MLRMGAPGPGQQVGGVGAICSCAKVSAQVLGIGKPGKAGKRERHTQNAGPGLALAKHWLPSGIARHKLLLGLLNRVGRLLSLWHLLNRSVIQTPWSRSARLEVLQFARQ